MNISTRHIKATLGILALIQLAACNSIAREGEADKYFMVKDSQTLEPIADALVLRWWIYHFEHISLGFIPEGIGINCGKENLVRSNQKGELHFASSTYVPPWGFQPINGAFLETAAHKKGMELDRLDRVNGIIYLKKDGSQPRERFTKLKHETSVGCDCGEYQASLYAEASSIYTVPLNNQVLGGRGCNFLGNFKK